MSNILPVHIDFIIHALADETQGLIYYLDLETGGIFSALELDTGDSDGEQRRAYLDHPERFVEIDWPWPVEKPDIIHLFIEHLPDAPCQRQLRRAFHHAMSFRDVEENLQGYADEREQWRAFRDQSLSRIAVEILEENEIEAEMSKWINGRRVTHETIMCPAIKPFM
jgi:hypothetical protein